MKEVYYSSCSSPIGIIWMASDGGGVCLLRLGGIREEEFLRDIGRRGWQPRPDQGVNQGVMEEIRGYFEGRATRFSSPLHPQGSPFDMKVWEELQRIPLGETRSYEEIAQAVESPRGCRAIGGANRRNPLPLLIPCHRVIRKNGGLGGFSCGQEIKKWLLHFEQKLVLRRESV
jgi:O-6-methylguanine DNA methyltransferase